MAAQGYFLVKFRGCSGELLRKVSWLFSGASAVFAFERGFVTTRCSDSGLHCLVNIEYWCAVLGKLCHALLCGSFDLRHVARCKDFRVERRAVPRCDVRMCACV